MYDKSLEELSNYKVYVDGSSTPATLVPNSAVVSADKKSVTFQLNTPLSHRDSYEVVVENVLDASYKKIEKYSTDVKYFLDTNAPKLLSAKVSGTNLVLTYDEPVQAVGTAITKVNGVDVSAAGTASTNTGEYTLTLSLAAHPELLQSGTYTVVNTGATDLVGNVADTQTTTYTVNADTQVPSIVSVSQVNDSRTLKVKVSEPLKAGYELDDVAAAGKLVIKKGNYTFPNTRYTVTLDPNDTTNTTYLITFLPEVAGEQNPLFASGENSVSLSISAEGFKDVTDNLGKAYTGTVTMVKDVTAPSVLNTALNKVSLSGTTDTLIQVKFNEEIDPTVVGTGIVVKKDGVILNGAISAARNSTDYSVLDITLADTTPSVGTYTVELPAGTVKDLAGNKSAALTTTATYSAATTYVQPTVITSGNNNNDILIDFSGVLTATDELTDSAIDLSNYKLDGANLPAGTKIAFNGDKQHVKITLPKEFVPSTANYTLSISTAVKSKAGVVVGTSTGKTFTATVNLVDNVAPVLKEAKLKSSTSSTTVADQIELTFSEPITATNADDFIITVNGTKVTATAGTPSTNKLVLNISDINLATSTVTVKVAGEDDGNTVMDTVDAAGNVLKAGTVVTATK
ncbi:Ig-like domain-containing protein [Geobacillus zalihae]|nr:Ig-like domain-containing protein [Geobacillus zalihae]